MSFLAQYVAGHPGFRELEVAEYTAGQLRLVVENLRYASYSLVWLQDRQVWQWIGSDYSDVTLEGEVRRTREILADEDAYHWVMELNGAPLGNINLHEIADLSRHFGRRAASLTYFIGIRSSWGKGIASAVVKAVVRWAFSDGRFEAILARVLEQNPASIRVLTKSGFRHDGIEAYDGPDLGEPAVWQRYVAFRV